MSDQVRAAELDAVAKRLKQQRFRYRPGQGFVKSQGRRMRDPEAHRSGCGVETSSPDRESLTELHFGCSLRNSDLNLTTQAQAKTEACGV